MNTTCPARSEQTRYGSLTCHCIAFLLRQFALFVLRPIPGQMKMRLFERENDIIHRTTPTFWTINEGNGALFLSTFKHSHSHSGFGSYKCDIRCCCSEKEEEKERLEWLRGESTHMHTLTRINGQPSPPDALAICSECFSSFSFCTLSLCFVYCRCSNNVWPRPWPNDAV